MKSITYTKKVVQLLLIAFAVSPITAQNAGWGPQSRVETKTIHSHVLKADRDFSIYLPKSYDTDSTRKYPVLYLLHGLTGVNTSWFENEHAKDVADLLMASGEAVEMIIVSPNAGGDVNKGAWNGYFNMPGWNYESFFFNEFLPYVEKTYRVLSDKKHRAIAGLSMGGGGATSYGQRYPQMFASVYAMSALMNIPQEGAVPSKNPTDKMALLTNSVLENNCIKYVLDADAERKAGLATVKWFVDCGDDDFLLDRNIEFTQAMRKKQIPCEFRIRDGAHNSEYWHTALYLCLPFVSQSFAKQ